MGCTRTIQCEQCEDWNTLRCPLLVDEALDVRPVAYVVSENGVEPVKDIREIL